MIDKDSPAYRSIFFLRSHLVYNRDDVARFPLTASEIGTDLLDMWLLGEDPDVLPETIVAVPIVVLQYAYGLYYDFESLESPQNMERFRHAFRNWQRIIRRIIQARTAGEVIPEVQVFDFDSYPRIMTLLGIIEAT